LADRGVTLDVDWCQIYQEIVDGGVEEKGEASANLDYRLNLDLMRMGLVPGALVTARGQSRFGDTVNGISGLLLPVNTYGDYPVGEGDIAIALTELNWTQFLSEKLAMFLGKITTMSTANEFSGGEGRSQFMNFQLSFSASVAQLAPYSTLAVGGVWMPSPKWTVTSILMNYQDSSTTTGFEDIGEGTTWANMADYLFSLNELPGGGTFSVYYSFGTDFDRIGGLNVNPATEEVTLSTASDAWAVNWSGWQYVLVEDGSDPVDPGNGRQDLQGLGVFAQVGLADEDTNPITWSLSGGLSGRGSIPTRDDDTWGVGYFHNDLQDLDNGLVAFAGSVNGLEVYYDIALAGSASLTLDAQWTTSALPSVEDATLLAARLNVGF
jgi:porin